MKLAMIPARGGSKRIPRKNIKEFLGKPIIAYSIEAATKSGCFDKIVVSTDDEEIAEVANSYGAEVPFVRPPGLSDDHSTTVDVIKHCLNWYSNKKMPIGDICTIYATAPFIRPENIAKGMALIQDVEIDFAFPVTTFPFPIQRAVGLDDKSRVKMFYPEHLNTRSQDLVEAYHDAGQFYCGKASAFLRDEPIFGNSSMAIPLPRKEVQDIDTTEDWEAAEIAYEILVKA